MKKIFLAQTFGSALAQLIDPINYIAIIWMLVTYKTTNNRKLFFSFIAGTALIIIIKLFSYHSVLSWPNELGHKFDLSTYMLSILPGAFLIILIITFILTIIDTINKKCEGLSK